MSFDHVYYNPIVERLFGDTLGTQRCRAPSTRDAYQPRLDLHKSEESNTVTAQFELPGLTSDNVTIDVHQNRLTVSGELSVEEEAQNYLVRERRSGKFSRTLQLPFGTKAEHVNAKMENGVLTITFPKTSPEQQAKRIPIQ